MHQGRHGTPTDSWPMKTRKPSNDSRRTASRVLAPQFSRNNDKCSRHIRASLPILLSEARIEVPSRLRSSEILERGQFLSTQEWQDEIDEKSRLFGSSVPRMCAFIFGFAGTGFAKEPNKGHRFEQNPAGALSDQLAHRGKKDVYKAGETVSLFFTADRDCFVPSSISAPAVRCTCSFRISGSR